MRNHGIYLFSPSNAEWPPLTIACTGAHGRAGLQMKVITAGLVMALSCPIEIMSVTHSPDFIASCKCGYISTVLSMRGRMQPASCVKCHSLINATRRLFRFDHEPCPACGATIDNVQLFGTGWYRTDQPTSIACPKCDTIGLILRDICGPSPSYTDEFPDEGDLIHAELRSRGRIMIPDLHTESGSVWFTKTPALEIGTRVIATVVSITTMAVNVGEVELPHHQGVRDLQIQFEGVLSNR